MSKKQRRNAKRWNRRQRKAEGLLTTQPAYLFIVKIFKWIVSFFNKPKPPSPAAPAIALAKAA